MSSFVRPKKKKKERKDPGIRKKLLRKIQDPSQNKSLKKNQSLYLYTGQTGLWTTWSHQQYCIFVDSRWPEEI